jgi:hypothetical protein
LGDGQAVARLQVHGFGNGMGGNAWAKGGLCGDMDVATQKVSEVHEEAAKVHQAATGLEIDEEVDVAVVAGIARGDRAEDAHTRCPSAVGRSGNLIATAT